MIMKKLFFLLVLLCSVAVSNAQEKETEKSQSKALSKMIEIMKIAKSKIQELTK